MDAHRFDDFARSLGIGASRRGLARFLGGLAFAGGISGHELGTTNAKKKHKKKKKRDKKKGCPHHCSGGICCGDQCVSVLTDRHNCGGCGGSCEKEKGSCICTEKEFCLNGECKPCEEPKKICVGSAGDQCVDLQTDRNNCGTCGNVCQKSPTSPQRDFVCQNGECVCTGNICNNDRCCPAGFSVCVDGGAGCCPDFYHSCGDGRCCPDGFVCGGDCGSECCPI